jgi:hypothetical protein
MRIALLAALALLVTAAPADARLSMRESKQTIRSTVARFDPPVTVTFRHCWRRHSDQAVGCRVRLRMSPAISRDVVIRVFDYQWGTVTNFQWDAPERPACKPHCNPAEFVPVIP